MDRKATSPDGTAVTVRPIKPGDLDRIVLRCWPDRDAIGRLFADQGTIGMAAWEGEKCVGQLHCYRVTMPDGRNENWPKWNNWWSGWALTEYVQQGSGRDVLEFVGAVWCHACCHVGRTLEASPTDDPDPRYIGRGIGTALCQASLRWAREHDYSAVLAMGAPKGLFEYAVWSGHVPWTTYAKLGFDAVDARNRDDALPDWAQGDSPPHVMAEVRAALAAGRATADFHERLMVLRLRTDNGS